MRSWARLAGAPLAAATLLAGVSHAALATSSTAAPKVIVISLDGARPDLINRFIASGALPANSGLGLIRSKGSYALQNVTATPSLTAVSHIAIATGSTAVNNDIPANTFQALVQPQSASLSGFAAPIGGYDISDFGGPVTLAPTAEPLWVALRAAGKKVVAATWPGADGATIALNGTTVQGPADRTVDYTVPFGAFGGLGAQGFQLAASDFTDAPLDLAAQFAAAGHASFSPVKTKLLQTVYCADVAPASCGTFPAALRYDLTAAAFDSTDDGLTNYDQLAVFDATKPIPVGPFAAPSTGPAYISLGSGSAPFFFEGSGNVVGTSFIVSYLSPDLATVRLTRYGANYIPRNLPVLADVDDINTTVGFWRPQPDFRIPERISPGFTTFPDAELEAIYQDQVRTFTRYQSRLARHAIRENRSADLVMIYFEQPDGSSHQFWLTDKLQATNPQDANTIGANQDQAKIARYHRYIENAYRRVDGAVDDIIDQVGRLPDGTPRSNIFVVSDHGFAPFNTAVSLFNLLKAGGIDTSKIAIKTSGPAANIYVNLAGRELNGTVPLAEYETLVSAIADVLKTATDANPIYTKGKQSARVFAGVASRPTNCATPGFCTSPEIGQDYGDVFAIMRVGYNFDGTQNPGVARLGDPPYSSTSVFSVPNFYGAHGYLSDLPVMSASFLAAGPAIRKSGTPVTKISNIDVAPTIMKILDVAPAATVDGGVINEVLK